MEKTPAFPHTLSKTERAGVFNSTNRVFNNGKLITVRHIFSCPPPRGRLCALSGQPVGHGLPAVPQRYGQQFAGGGTVGRPCPTVWATHPLPSPLGRVPPQRRERPCLLPLPSRLKPCHLPRWGRLCAPSAQPVGFGLRTNRTNSPASLRSYCNSPLFQGEFFYSWQPLVAPR